MSEQQCNCRQCLRDRKEENPPGSGWPTELTMMILCPICGNKRCPHATNHRHACTGSNEPGQVGSAYAERKLHNVGSEGPEQAQLANGPARTEGSTT